MFPQCNGKPFETMTNLRVCHLGKFYPPAPGGIETRAHRARAAQADLGAGVQVFCMNHEPGPTVTEADGPVEVTRFGRRASAAKLDFCPGLAERLRTVEADILHMQVPNPTMILALLAARPRVPLVVMYQSDVVRQRLRALVFRPLERLAYRRARAVLTTSPLYPGGSTFLRPYGDRLQVLPMGIDLAPYLDPAPEVRDEGRDESRRQEHAARADPALEVGAAGRMVYYKGFVNALRALTRVPGTLLLAGDGPDLPALRDEARRLGVSDRVVFLGNLHYLSIIPYYLAADAFWFPSNARSEAFGLVQVEAMASGCPVLNTWILHGGVSWVSRHRRD